MENIDKIENIEDILKYFSGDSIGEIGKYPYFSSSILSLDVVL